MTHRSIALLIAAGLFVTSPVFAQNQADSRQEILKEIARVAGEAARVGVVAEPFATQVSPAAPTLTATYIVAAKRKTEESKALLKVMDARVDKQVAAAPAAKGGTSLATKGAVPAVLGFAVENGALTQQVSGTVVSFRGTPIGIVKALQAKGLVDILDDYRLKSAQKFASKWSFGVSFDTSRGTQAGTLLGSAQQLSSWSVRYEALNERNARMMVYAHQWSRMAQNSAPYDGAVVQVQAALSAWTEFTAWRMALVEKVRTEVDAPLKAGRKTMDAAKVDFEKMLAQEFAKLEELTPPPPVVKALDDYVAQLTVLEKGIDEIYKEASRGQLVTLDWTAKRDPKQPDLYTLTGVWEKALGKKLQNDLTVNGAFSLYRTEPIGSSHQFKNGELTSQYDRPLGKILVAPFILTLAFKYQYLPNDTPASTEDAVAAMAAGTSTTSGSSTAIMAPKGHLVIGQAKLTIPVKGGVKVPLSFTVANRTELIKETEVRANFGVTFDFDAIMAEAFGNR
jgi:hypothetical protein